MVDGVLQIRIPSFFDAATEAYWVSEMTRRMSRRRSTDSVDLARRARKLSAMYALPQPEHIRWSSRQNTVWGSCTPMRRTIRISDRVAAFPEWVIDYVIVHELAHLAESGHSPAFWALVARYPKAERARGYLEAKADGVGGGTAGQSDEDGANLLSDH